MFSTKFLGFIAYIFGTSCINYWNNPSMFSYIFIVARKTFLNFLQQFSKLPEYPQELFCFFFSIQDNIFWFIYFCVFFFSSFFNNNHPIFVDTLETVPCILNLSCQTSQIVPGKVSRLPHQTETSVFETGTSDRSRSPYPRKNQWKNVKNTTIKIDQNS